MQSLVMMPKVKTHKKNKNRSILSLHKMSKLLHSKWTISHCPLVFLIENSLLASNFRNQINLCAQSSARVRGIENGSSLGEEGIFSPLATSRGDCARHGEHVRFFDPSASERKQGIAKIYLQPRNKKKTCLSLPETGGAQRSAINQMGKALETICAKNFGVNMLDAGGPTLYLDEKKGKFTQSLPRHENEGEAHK
jgi:hypothetical protein